MPSETPDVEVTHTNILSSSISPVTPQSRLDAYLEGCEHAFLVIRSLGYSLPNF